MITYISPREAELSRQIDEQGGHLVAWRDRAIAAEAELARLRAVEPVAWYDDDMDCAYTASELDGGTADGLAPLYRAAPPAQPAARKDCGEAGCAEGRCGNAGCLPSAQPAEPVQRLSDERAAFEAWHNEYRTQELVRRDDTYYNTHARCRWEGWQARAIESALQPGWRDDLVNGLMGSTISETCRADAAEAAIESIVELLDQHTDDLHVNHGCRPTESVSKARDIAIAALPPAPKATK